MVDRNYSFCTHSILRWWIYWELGLKSQKGSSIELKNIFVETKINVLAKCPNCETEQIPYTVSVYEDTLGTYACRKCETSLKLEDLKKSDRPEPKESFIGYLSEFYVPWTMGLNLKHGTRCVLTICRFPHGVKIGEYQHDMSI